MKTPKFWPLIFSAPMILALGAGRKTQTRRLISASSLGIKNGPYCYPAARYGPETFTDLAVPFHSPWHMTEGDQIWVRESVWQWGRWVSNGKTKTGKPARKFLPLGRYVVYCADQPNTPSHAPDLNRAIFADELWVKRSAMFMPRWASRYTLTVTGTQIEPLQNITPADCMAEGLESEEISGATYWKNYEFISAHSPYNHKIRAFGNPIDSYRSLWNSIHGADKEAGWDANNWVRAIAFTINPALAV